MKILKKRLSKQNSKTFEDFLEKNSDIVENTVSVMCEYFIKEMFFSDESGKTYLQPDLKSL